jgi:Core-2/I-Branching enzyme
MWKRETLQMNICYLVVVHQKFEQAARLIRRLSGPNVSFVVHVDAKVADAAFQKLKEDTSGVGPIFFAKRERARWGSFELVQAIFNCIHTAILNCGKFDRCILLSGQDYPIKSTKEIFNFFGENSTLEFIEAFLKDASKKAPGWSPFYRFRRYHFWIDNRKHTIPILTKRLPDFRIFHGSTWWALSREAIIYLDGTFAEDERFRAAFRSGFLVEEACIQTMMMDSPFSDRVVGSDTTFAEWTPTSGPHPKTFDKSDFEKLMQSRKLFARKFDASVDSEILDMLDAVHEPSFKK